MGRRQYAACLPGHQHDGNTDCRVVRACAGTAVQDRFTGSRVRRRARPLEGTGRPIVPKRIRTPVTAVKERCQPESLTPASFSRRAWGMNLRYAFSIIAIEVPV